MIKRIVPITEETYLDEAIARFQSAKRPVALTGAGISVESGIPDFRSPGGLWSIYNPDEYATLAVFQRRPEKAWILYRALGETLAGAQPNPAHIALADLERTGRLAGVITQNVDGLHQAAGSKRVIEIHGEHRHLHCLKCGQLEEVKEDHLSSSSVPCCRRCDYPLKPNVVLFGESVRGMAEIRDLLRDCDLLLVIGTSVQVYPSAGLPSLVKQNGGLIYEFNQEPTSLTRGESGGMLGFLTDGGPAGTDYLFLGNASLTVPLLC